MKSDEQGFQQVLLVWNLWNLWMFLWSVSVVSVCCSTSLFRTTWSCRSRRCPAHPERCFEQRRLGEAQLGSQGTQRAHGNPKRFSPFLLDSIGFQHFFLKCIIQHINMNIYTYTKCVQHASICIVCICMPCICFCV